MGGGVHTEPEKGAPVIEHNDSVGVDLTDGGGPASETPESTGQVDIEMEWSNISDDTTNKAFMSKVDGEIETEATAARECPPQLHQPSSNHGQQR